MTPPIRGGIYRKLGASSEHTGSDSDTDCDAEDTCDDASSSTSVESFANSLTSASSAAISLEEKVLHQTLTQRRAKGAGDHVGESNAEDRKLLSPSRYTDLLMQEEIDQCISEYPSLNPTVQQDIIQRYRELHQKVRDAGLYDCPYVEYGKELSRYLTLFSLFAVALRYEWYMTSAVCLGLFWVSLLVTENQSCDFILTSSQHQIMFTAHDAGRTCYLIDSFISFASDLTASAAKPLLLFVPDPIGPHANTSQMVQSRITSPSIPSSACLLQISAAGCLWDGGRVATMFTTW